MKNPLLNEMFLKRLSDLREREIMTRITVFDSMTDKPKEFIQGHVTGGSINIDGNSAVRRSCSLTLVATDPEAAITEAYWAFKNKIKVEIGIINSIDKEFPEIIWFSQGIFIITSFTIARSLNNLTISIQGKDKMCLLNGDVGGNVYSEVNFGIEEYYDRETTITTKTKIPIKTIIQTALVQYAGEKPWNIIINDLEEYAYELWEYQGDAPIYLIMNDSFQAEQMTLDGDLGIIENNNGEKAKKLSELSKFYSMDTINAEYNDDASKFKFNQSDGEYNKAATKIVYGQTAGYHETPLVYNNDLILSAGEAITSLFDKIKQMLGEFEYFYDLEGRFVFQKKKNYIAELFSPINGEIVNPIMSSSPYAYRFEDWSKFTNMPDSSNIGQIKNDFVIWGNRNGAGNAKLPIHARFAIHKKPEYYVSRPKEYKSYYDWEKVGFTSEGPYYKPLFIIPSAFYKIPEDLPKYISIIYELCQIRGIVNEKNEYEVKVENFYLDNTVYTIGDKKAIYYTEKEYEEMTKTLQSLLVNNIDEKTIEEKAKNMGLDPVPEDIKERIEYWFDLNNSGTTDSTDLGEFKLLASGIFDESNENDRIYFSTEETKKIVYIANNLSVDKIDSIEKYIDQVEKIDDTTQNYYLVNVDWRELIYQMAIDYQRFNTEADFYLKLQEDNPWCVEGRTGYECYYTDLLGFWRQLYNPIQTNEDLQLGDEYYPAQGRKLQTGENDFVEEDAYWNKKIHLSPNLLNFWFDFLDTASELGKYSVSNIGDRITVDSKSKITAIRFKDVPEALYVLPNEKYHSNVNAYIPLQVPQDMETLFKRSSQGPSAFSVINNLIYNHTCLPESLNLSCLPIYHLQPNSRIWIKDKGDYIITKLTYNLTHSGMMSMSCNKVTKQFY